MLIAKLHNEFYYDSREVFIGILVAPKDYYFYIHKYCNGGLYHMNGQPIDEPCKLNVRMIFVDLTKMTDKHDPDSKDLDKYMYLHVMGHEKYISIGI